MSQLSPYRVAALYRFTPIADPTALKAALKPQFEALKLCGSLLIAPEGINGTLAGSPDAIDAMLDLLATHCGLLREDVKFSEALTKPFNRLKLRLKREIITFGQPHADPSTLAGTYVEAQDWNALLADPDVVLLDTRNEYEVDVGTFKGALNPVIDKFTGFADYVRGTLDPAKHKKVAMFCTGGIRCEKASAFMRAEGFETVYHLKGGILKYLETVPAEQSRWQGDCYVFDRRVAVGHGLTPGNYGICFSCGRPLDAEARQSQHYEPGVSCSACHTSTDPATKARFRMRQRQLEQAKNSELA